MGSHVSAPAISPELLQLLETKLDNLEKLELVLAVRDVPETTVAELARELQIGHDVLLGLATEVGRTKLVTVSDGAVKLTASPEDVVLLDEAAALYASDRRSVMRVMSKIAMDHIRKRAARSFADAFDFRKKKKGDDRG